VQSGNECKCPVSPKKNGATKGAAQVLRRAIDLSGAAPAGLAIVYTLTAERTGVRVPLMHQAPLRSVLRNANAIGARHCIGDKRGAKDCAPKVNGGGEKSNRSL